ncbi:DEAD/DEAH box helicase [Faunimonas sp. B44]|uniref:DEAD/DEAH box helicase n=1 Tax=Faunimonas sp. B44 TaxID=3461493 RepID=UPI004043FE5B
MSSNLFTLMEAIDGFNGTVGQPTEARVAAWRPVQSALRATIGREVRADDYLGSLTIYQAGSFALDVRETERGPDFVPILMSHDWANSIEDDAPLDEEGGGVRPSLPNAEDAALLTPDLHDTFVRERWARSRSTNDAYVLGRNTFLVLDPALKCALDVVRLKRAAPLTERRDFVRNPRPSIAEALGGDDADLLSAVLFVETAQYSERVTGLQVWNPPKLPWLTKKAQQWLPERFSVAIGDTKIDLTPARVEDLADKVEAARSEGRSTIDVDGTPHLVEDVVQAIAPFLGGQNLPEPEENKEDWAALVGAAEEAEERKVLDIDQNLEELRFSAALKPRKAAIPSEFPTDLCPHSRPKEHQRHGFAWLVDAWASGLPGVLLADDMGLGKTYQALAFLAWFRKNRPCVGSGAQTGPILVVAPTALLRNWAAEAERHLAAGALGGRIDAFAPDLKRLKRPKTADWTPEDALDVQALRDADWILTTYETLADNHRAFARVGYPVVVFDEMQKVKSPSTINTHAAKAVNADFVVGLTGTPIENRLEDLWCIMDRVFPGYLGTLRAFSKEHEDENPASLSALKDKMDKPHPMPPAPAVMLRRMKEAILEGLPSKTVQVRRLQMPAPQAEAYQRAVGLAMTGERSKGAMLKALQAFRGISLHPDGAEGVDPYDPKSVQEWVSRSARLTQAVSILHEIERRGEKALLFLEDRAVQAAFAAACTTLFAIRSQPPIINGALPGAKRQAVVDEFQAMPPGFHLLVLSPKAAGIGLTITAANHVIHLSRWWNPAVEDQCNDRVYRIGQDKPVTVHVPMAVHPDYGEGSFDVTLDRLLERKRKLSREMLTPPVSESDIETLFGATVSSPEQRGQAQ